MKFSPRHFLFLIPLLFLGFAKKTEVSIRFHTEGNPQDGAPFVAEIMLQHPPRKASISKMPQISERDVDAIHAFPAADGSYGCAFRLNTHGRFSLETFSTQQRGSFVVAFVNGRQVTDLLIDKPIKDGIIIIPNGLTMDEITLLQKAYPPPKQKKEKKKKEKKEA